MIKLIFIVVFIIFIGCDEKKVASISKKNILEDSVKTNLFVSEVIDSVYQKQQFDSLLIKSQYVNIKKFEITEDDRSYFYVDKVNKFYNLTYKNFNILQLCTLYSKLGYKCSEIDYPRILYLYSVHNLNNNIMGITILSKADGYSLRYLTYKNNKIISFGYEPFALFFGDMGVGIESITENTSNSTFLTVNKIVHVDKLIGHSEILTTINSEGLIKQQKRVFLDKKPFE